MRWDNLEYDRQVQRFLDNSNMCIHHERMPDECPPWTKYTDSLYEPGDKIACSKCGHLHGDRFHISLIRLEDTDNMCEFEFWSTPILKNEPPPEPYIFASLQEWMFYPKSLENLRARVPKASDEDLNHLLNLSWKIFNFFTEDEREALRRD
jgi:hypothetical protein